MGDELQRQLSEFLSPRIVEIKAQLAAHAEFQAQEIADIVAGKQSSTEPLRGDRQWVHGALFVLNALGIKLDGGG